jgi:hypothetical protein
VLGKEIFPALARDLTNDSFPLSRNQKILEAEPERAAVGPETVSGRRVFAAVVEWRHVWGTNDRGELSVHRKFSFLKS